MNTNYSIIDFLKTLHFQEQYQDDYSIWHSSTTIHLFITYFDKDSHELTCIYVQELKSVSINDLIFTFCNDTNWSDLLSILDDIPKGPSPSYDTFLTFNQVLSHYFQFETFHSNLKSKNLRSKHLFSHRLNKTLIPLFSNKYLSNLLLTDLDESHYSFYTSSPSYLKIGKPLQVSSNPYHAPDTDFILSHKIIHTDICSLNGLLIHPYADANTRFLYFQLFIHSAFHEHDILTITNTNSYLCTTFITSNIKATLPLISDISSQITHLIEFKNTHHDQEINTLYNKYCNLNFNRNGNVLTLSIYNSLGNILRLAKVLQHFKLLNFSLI